MSWREEEHSRWSWLSLVFISRLFLAWSFDRIISASFVHVTDRFHTPTAAIILGATLAIIPMYLEYFTSFISTQVNAIFLYSAVWFLAAVSAAVLPFRRRRIFETAQKSMVGRVPVVSLFGVLGAILFAPNNELVKKAVHNYPKRLRGYVWPDPHASGSLQLGEWGFRGIKLHPLMNAFLPTDEVVLPIMDEARKRRIPVAIHSGHPRSLSLGALVSWRSSTRT
ncbi:MAG: amidohydrolase family protein [Thaumarchaeota archaeon]|nr:amidohydrolase family protein [Nitrososphaerota archaeon]MCS4539979.1 amidohydrolase family protein [Nitrososphaerota archaeon]